MKKALIPSRNSSPGLLARLAISNNKLPNKLLKIPTKPFPKGNLVGIFFLCEIFYFLLFYFVFSFFSSTFAHGKQNAF